MRGHLRCLAWLAITSVGLFTFVVWNMQNDANIQEQTRQSSTTSVSSVFKQFCQFLEDPLKGSEGRAPDGFKLTGLLITFRHGERSPVVQLKADAVHPDCSAYFNVDRHSFDVYQSVIRSKDFKKFLKTDVNFNKFPVVPERSKCQLGRMTAEGALQLVRLGNYLRHEYASTGFFKGLQKEDVFLVSSMYPRTFHIVLNACKTTFFCGSKGTEFLDKAPSKLRQRLTDLVDLLGVKVLEHPLEFVDALLGRYACRRLPLPCNKHGDCITYQDFKEANLEAIDIVKRLTINATLGSTARRLFVAEAYPILKDLVHMIQQIRNKNFQNKQIRVYSGHDVTLWPLVFVLGLANNTQDITYASRIVFEIYQATGKDALQNLPYLRVVVNGVDRTGDIDFCKPLQLGLCSAIRLEHFLKTEFFNLAGVDNFEGLCKS
uniref:2-phosphoxylose phosphatase 1 n=1 Tax=Ditylenchus dipsaci TaxID=166011 RepID=A0A915EN56_9BILA